MKFRFKVPRIYKKLFPEIDHIKDDEQQFRAFAEAWQNVWPTAIVLMVLIAYVSSTINNWGLEIVKSVGEHVAQFIFILFCLPLFIVIDSAIHGGQIRRTIRIKINEAGTSMCIECGYLLEGIEGPACPECGNVPE